MIQNEKCEKSILISIVIPVYNGVDYICDAISSVIGLENDEIEILIVDDGSTDNTGEICKGLAHSNIHYFRISNHGTGFARNIGMSKASGSWIAFLDADDLVLPNAFDSSFCDYLRNAEFDILYFSCIKASMDLKTFCPRYAEETIRNNMPMLPFWSSIYKRKFLIEKNIMFYEYKEQDIETAFKYRAFSQASSIRVFPDCFFYCQRINYHSNTHTWNVYVTNRTKALVYLDLARSTKKSGDIPFLCNVVLKCCIKAFAEYYNNDSINKDEYLKILDIQKAVRKYLTSASNYGLYFLSGIAGGFCKIMPQKRCVEKKFTKNEIAADKIKISDLQRISASYSMKNFKEKDKEL